jgi:carboxypeptidase Q
VLFTNEENGLRGATEYAAAHPAAAHVMALEADSGGFAPRGFSLEGNDVALGQLVDIVSLLEDIGAGRAETGHSGADVGPLVRGGTPGLGLSVDGARYFDYHHTHADTLDKVDRGDLKKSVAAVAVLAFVVADMPDRFGEPR